MRIIKLTKGFETLVSDDDYDRLTHWKWCANGNSAERPYAVSRLGSSANRLVKMHQLILPPKERFVVDHADGNSLNNCRENLRYATYSQNVQNSRRNGKPLKGIYLHSCGKYHARIRTMGKDISLGYHPNAEEAARAYDAAALEHFGEFARPNFPVQP